jgi:pimeloyl-ACP methyl ester carboxylesterase
MEATMAVAANSARIVKTATDSAQAKAVLGVERRLLDHYGLQGKTQYVQLKHTPIRVRVLEVGTGRPMLVVPGGAGEGFSWLALAAQLKDRRLIIINRPGAGLSDFVDHRQVDLRDLAIDTIGSVMDAYDLASVPIICNSMGGLWSFWFALAQPQRVTSLVQAGCPALVHNTSAPFMMRLMSVPGLNRRLVKFMVPKDVDSALAGLKKMGSSEEVIKAQPRLMNEAIYTFARVPAYLDAWRTLIESVLTLRGTNARYRFGEESLAQLKIPVLLLWGDNDPFGDLTAARQNARLIPRGQLCELSAGHLPYWDQPETCARLIQEFLT